MDESLCRSRAGLVRHESMMHRRVEGRVRFACEDYGLEVATRGALVGHRKTCGEGRRLEDGWREFGGCGARVSYANFAVNCGLAGLGGGKQWRRVTRGGGERANNGGRDARVGGEMEGPLYSEGAGGADGVGRGELVVSIVGG